MELTAGEALGESLRREMARLITARRDDAVEWLTALVAMSSEAPRERQAQQLVQQISTSEGLVAALLPADPTGDLARDPRFIETDLSYEDRPNCLIRMAGAPKQSALVCNAHIDTVAVGDGWLRDPAGELHGNRMYGRGACDTKASLVSALLAASVIQTLGVQPAAPLEIHSVIDEEPGGNGTLALIRALEGQTPPRLVIVMEPTGLDVLLGHRGMDWHCVRVIGVQAHGSMAGGVNAIEAASVVVDGLRGLNHRFAVEPWDAGYPAPRVNVGIIAGGHEVYTTPGSCDIEFSVRFAPGQRDRVAAAVQDTLESSASTGAHLETIFVRTFDASETDEADHAAQTLLRSLRGIRGHADFGRLAGTCDMRHYRNLLGVPSVIFGPGDLRNAHGPDEFVEIEDILVAARALAELSLAWTDQKENQ